MSQRTCPCDISVAFLRSAQCDDAEIQAIVLMHDRGKCTLLDEHRAEYEREVVIIRGYGMPRCDVMRGDGSIPQPTCILPVGHPGAHYG